MLLRYAVLAVGAAVIGVYRRHPEWITLICHTLGRDLAQLIRFARLFGVLKMMQWRGDTVHSLLKEKCIKHPDKPMIIFADTGAVWTFRDVDEYSNRVARLFFSLGHSRGDIVALFMTNRPEYVAVEVGLAKIGIVVVLVNHNLRSDSLVHSINFSRCSAVVYESCLEKAIGDVASKLEAEPRLMKLDSNDIQKELESHPSSEPSPLANSSMSDTFVYIYTSGTTGMPKPAVFDHFRLLTGAVIAAGHIDLKYRIINVFTRCDVVGT